MILLTSHNLWMNADSFISTLLLRLQSNNKSWIARIAHGHHLGLAFAERHRPSRRAGRSDYLFWLTWWKLQEACVAKIFRMDERAKSINCHFFEYLWTLRRWFFWHHIIFEWMLILLFRRCCYVSKVTMNRGSLGSHMDIIWWLAFANRHRPSRRAGRSDYL